MRSVYLGLAGLLLLAPFSATREASQAPLGWPHAALLGALVGAGLFLRWVRGRTTSRIIAGGIVGSAAFGMLNAWFGSPSGVGAISGGVGMGAGLGLTNGVALALLLSALQPRVGSKLEGRVPWVRAIWIAPEGDSSTDPLRPGAPDDPGAERKAEPVLRLKWTGPSAGTLVRAVFLLGVVLGFAHMFRYQPLPPLGDSPSSLVWDRWEHRLCIAHIRSTEGVSDQVWFCPTVQLFEP